MVDKRDVDYQRILWWSSADSLKDYSVNGHLRNRQCTILDTAQLETTHTWWRQWISTSSISRSAIPLR